MGWCSLLLLQTEWFILDHALLIRICYSIAFCRRITKRSVRINYYVSIYRVYSHISLPLLQFPFPLCACPVNSRSKYTWLYISKMPDLLASIQYLSMSKSWLAIVNIRISTESIFFPALIAIADRGLQSTPSVYINFDWHVYYHITIHIDPWFWYNKTKALIFIIPWRMPISLLLSVLCANVCVCAIISTCIDIPNVYNWIARRYFTLEMCGIVFHSAS